MPGYNRSAQCFEAWFAAHLTTCNDIFKVQKCSCFGRDRFQRKNTLITSAVGSLIVCLRYAGLHAHTTLVVVEHSSCRESLL